MLLDVLDKKNCDFEKYFTREKMVTWEKIHTVKGLRKKSYSFVV